MKNKLKPIFIDLRFFHKINLLSMLYVTLLVTMFAVITCKFVAQKYIEYRYLVWWGALILDIFLNILFYFIETRYEIERKQLEG